MPTWSVQPASAVSGSLSDLPESVVETTLSVLERNSPDAACPLSRAALDARTRVKRALHEPASIAFSVDAANAVRGLGAAACRGYDRPRRTAVRLGPRLDHTERTRRCTPTRRSYRRLGVARDGEHRRVLHAAAYSRLRVDRAFGRWGSHAHVSKRISDASPREQHRIRPLF